ncbi:MAG: peptidoglycan-binding protein [Devosia nanyangense]|uniref:Peptidoglycan-binding protein n=1 Tax=Devosia nanyangense TaxID=1228055 RepID=A0A933L588_9HYPH|nr:peptidoglycan-binding protein [Devosia nanyangense]
MTVEAFSSLPFQAGGAVAAAAGRTVLWAVAAYMRQPLRNTAVATLIGLSSMAGSNALYKQAHHHPAPLFGSFSTEKQVAKADIAPVMPAARPKKLTLSKLSTETTGSVAPAAAVDRVIGNADVIELQRKLTAFKLFDGTVDGLFGPRTARAIKAFEQMIGRTPRGLLTPEIIELIKATPITAEPEKLALTPPTAAKTAPAVTETVAPLALAEPEKPLAAAAKPLPAPAPLLATPAETVTETAATPPAAVATTDPSPALALDVAGDMAEDAIGALASGVTTMAMTSTASVPTRTVQTIAVKVTPPAPAQTMPAELTPSAESPAVPDDTQIVGAVQRGLSSLGFLHGEIDGVAGEATAKAIRNFEVYYNYDVTGRITPGLVKLLVQNGASI